MFRMRTLWYGLLEAGNKKVASEVGQGVAERVSMYSHICVLKIYVMVLRDLLSSYMLRCEINNDVLFC